MYMATSCGAVGCASVEMCLLQMNGRNLTLRS